MRDVGTAEPRTRTGPATLPVVEDGGRWRARTETTRYLAAATHLDRRYRTAVLDATVRETQRAVCPSYGVDLSVVARHAVVAERRAVLRDAALTTVLGTALVVACIGVRSARGPAGVAPSAAGLVLCAAALAMLALLADALEVSARMGTLSTMLRVGGHPEDLPRPGGRAGRALEDLTGADDGNVVVFAVGEPFVGSGVMVDAGSFTVPLIPQESRPGEMAAQPGRLTSGDVLDAVAVALRALREPNARVHTRLYVNGYDVVSLPELLPDPAARARARAPAALVRQIVERPTGAVRPYLCAEFTTWRGQLVVTAFIRVVARPGVLYVECAAYALPPLKAAYYTVDRLRIATAGQRLMATVATTARETFPALFLAPLRLTAAARSALATRRHLRQTAGHVLVDRGAATSIREQASAEEYGNYFMAQDTDMYVKVVQQKVVDVITVLLETRGYQTDKIKQIQNNTNISFNGGAVTVGAIGPQSRGTVGPRDRETSKGVHHG